MSRTGYTGEDGFELIADAEHGERLLRALAGVGKPEVSREGIEEEVRRELVGRLATRLMELAGGEGG